MHLMTMVLGQASIFFTSTVIHKETLIQNTWAFAVMWLKYEFICIILVSVNVFSPSWHRTISWIGILLAPNSIHITTEFWKIKTHFTHFHYNSKGKQQKRESNLKTYFADWKMWKHNNVYKCIQKLAQSSWIHTLHVSQPAAFCFCSKVTFHTKVQVFWDMTPWWLVNSCWCFKKAFPHLSSGSLQSFRPWRWRQKAPKCWDYLRTDTALHPKWPKT